MKIKKLTILVIAWAVATLCLLSGVTVKASFGDPYADLVLSVVGTFGTPTPLSNDPAVAADFVLGPPDAPPTSNFIQISDNSSITLVFIDNVALSDGSTSGADLRIYTYDLLYPGAAMIEVSADGVTFLTLSAPPLNDLARTCLGDNSQFCNYDDNLAGYIDLDFDAVGLSFVTHVRITDLSASIDGESVYPDLGFDLDAIEALNPGLPRCITPPAGLVSWWDGDDVSGIDAFDIQDGNDGTLINGVTTVIGKVSSAFSFDGINDYIEVGSVPSLTMGTGDLTVAAWVQILDNTHNNRFVDTGARQNEGYSIFYYSPGSFGVPGSNAFVVQWHRSGEPKDAGPNRQSVGGMDIGDGNWHHVAGVWDRDTAVKAYVDGVLVGSAAPKFASSEHIPNAFNLRIGSEAAAVRQLTDGHIDEVQIFNRALTGEEILYEFLAGSAGKCKFIWVDIDIKPGSYPNSINLGSHGSIPVAILSSEEFDATTVDPETVTLAGSGVAVRGKGNKFMAHEDDVNGDGLVDLVVQVETENFDPSSFQDGSAILTGTTYEGKSIEGSDEINIVPHE